MCIIFINVNSKGEEGDFSFILASNRDEYYDRPTQNFGPWLEDHETFGG
jgi:uncharacterized protein with NRDE domain